MNRKGRIEAIDVMRGLTLFLMLFVNDLYAPNVPAWLTHTTADFDGMGLADWVFPGFLFMVGMSVPFAIQSRLKRGESVSLVSFHILVRTISLLFIGVLMLNVSRLNPELTGMRKNLWAIFMYLCIFLIWNQYENIKSFYKVILKGLGFAGLVVLLLIFRSGTVDDPQWLVTGWWGILGLIGWGYFVTAFVYLIGRENLLLTGVIWLFFIGLNIFAQLNLLGFLNFAKPVFGVIISGNTPSIVMAGLFFSLLFRKLKQKNSHEFVWWGIALGLAALTTGFVLRNWFIISKIYGTPSWAMICNGISILLFISLFVVIDVLSIRKWSTVFKPAGKNSLTTYLAPDIIYYLIWMSSVPVLFYKQLDNSLLVVAGSLVWAFAMIGVAVLLSRIGIRLKL
ncbi:MAG TPA: DUF5009 domain-containing protein [Prolixibacteraceae bacterium]|nr:DUF5009 domain-containing protein [Prolixibacteraceae bacterium]